MAARRNGRRTGNCVPLDCTGEEAGQAAASSRWGRGTRISRSTHQPRTRFKEQLYLPQDFPEFVLQMGCSSRANHGSE